MPLEQLEHFTIACTDLERTRAFYCDMLGLEAGPRPALPFKGYWLYCGNVPVVHLGGADDMKAVTERTGGGTSTGALDHIAFRGRDAAETIARLKANDIPFRQNAVPSFGLHQVFVYDPDGLLIELNFRDAAP
jgi:catechol 2,3-dioxygenase-like lactoylglutathione lyase family enzyme